MKCTRYFSTITSIEKLLCTYSRTVEEDPFLEVRDLKYSVVTRKCSRLTQRQLSLRIFLSEELIFEHFVKLDPALLEHRVLVLS